MKVSNSIAALADIAARFFDGRWIDAPARPGKASGAFSHPTVPSAHPYILLNFTERIRDVYLSPDAFAQRTADASIADQLGDGLAAAGLPRPAPADNDRVGGWMLMYQAMESDHWLIAENCTRLIENLPTLTRDPAGALAAVYAFGAYVAVIVANATGAIALGVIAAMGAAAVLGIGIYRFLYAPLLA